MLLKKSFALSVLILVLASGRAWGQASATVGGTVSDASAALIPGVTVSASNTQTGIVSRTVTNESGTYQFPSLQTGTYKMSAELPGFQTRTYNNVVLSVSQQVRLNFTLQVGNVTQSVDVSVAVDTLLAASSASVGTVLSEYKIRDLPLASRDVLDLVSLAPGVEGDNIAGHRVNQVSTTRDGISVSDGRYDLGVFSQTYVSPDLIEEVRIVTSSADAEGSKASGVQLSTRSGTNVYRGSLFWTNHNTALTANTWEINRNGGTPDYLNRNQFGGRIGGPILKNKAFFFFLYDGQRTILKNTVTAQVLTATARQGLFRYFPGVNNGNVSAVVVGGNNPTAPVVDLSGNPVRPAAATGSLQSVSLYNKDPLRPGLDPTGFIQNILSKSPLPNYFETGDGLNTAGYRFVRRVKGVDGASGDGVNINRDQVNLRIDYNFNPTHKLFLTGTRERVPSEGNPPPFPGSSYIGEVLRVPQVYTGSLVSTLSSSLLNELRAGFKRGKHLVRVPYSNSQNGAEVFAALPKGANGYPFLANPVNFANYWAWGLGDRDQWSAETTYGDTLSLTHGQHAFKFGGELHRSFNHSMQAGNWLPTVTMGAATFAPVQGIDTAQFPGLLTTNQTRARSILADLSGSITQVVQAFELENATDTSFRDLFQQTRKGKHRQIHQNAFNVFAKDDWKILPDVTINVGIRWDYFGVPYDAHGLMGTPVGGVDSVYGLNGRSFNGTLTTVDFVGKNSPHPDRTLWNNDYNNVGPSIGLSWSMPYFGRDKTVLRAGYGITYQGGGRTFSNLDGAVGSIQGLRWSSTNTTYNLLWRSLSDIAAPLPKGGLLEPVTLTARNVAISAYERNFVNPYIQNINVELQREFGKATTVTVQYVGTKGSKLYSEVPLNQTSLPRSNQEFLDAVRMTQAGGNATLFNRLLNGLNVTGFGVVDGVTRTGSQAVRASTNTQDALANNDIGTLANFFNSTNAFSGVNGGLLRNAGLPENYFVPNPQFNNVTLNGNGGNSTYHSLTVQATRKLKYGLTNQTSYTWSRALGADGDEDNSSSFRDIYNQRLDKTLLSFHRTQSLRTNGTYELPFGPNRPLLSNAPSWVTRIVERMQLGAIGNWTSGAPLDIAASTASFSTSTANTPNIVGPLPKFAGTVVPAKDAPGAQYFTELIQVDDPFGRTLTTLQGLNGRFTNRALTDSKGNFILVNPGVGQLGTLGKRWIEGPGRYSLDMNVIKRVRLDESREFELRVDAINVLNHSNWGNPTLDINSTNFGRITTKTGNRTFTLNARLNF